MKILAAADVHGVRLVYEWLLAVASHHRVAAIILAGDLLGCPDGFDTVEAAQHHEARMVTNLLADAGVPVLYIMGNDDLVELNPRSERLQSIHGRRVACGAFYFVGYQYSPPFMGGPFEKPEAGIRTDLISLDSGMDANTVFVSHTPIQGILDPGIAQRSIGSPAIRDFLDRNPFRAHIHGHSHDGFGRAGRHFNVASAGRTRAMVVDLGTLEHQVMDGAGRPDA
jgi:Icc-related predicted phosphoesterase